MKSEDNFGDFHIPFDYNYHRQLKKKNLLLTYYNQFLSALSDPEKRTHLTNLGLKDAFDDPLYKELKIVGDNFKKTLDQMFIYKKGKLSKLTLKYGIF